MPGKPRTLSPRAVFRVVPRRFGETYGPLNPSGSTISGLRGVLVAEGNRVPLPSAEGFQTRSHFAQVARRKSSGLVQSATPPPVQVTVPVND